MEPSQVRQGLVDAATGVPGLRGFGHLPESIDPPVFVAGEVTIDYDQVPEGGLDDMQVTCHLYTSYADDRTGQQRLDGYLAREGPDSVKAAIEADRTLGGIATTLYVQRVTGYGIYEITGTRFYGARLIVRVWGP